MRVESLEIHCIRNVLFLLMQSEDGLANHLFTTSIFFEST
jgi:hypothetical protein